jgi:hypothetical protein
MKKSRWIIFLVAALLVVVAGSLDGDGGDSDRVLGTRANKTNGFVSRLVRRVTWKKHKNDEYGYSVRFPREWEIEERNTDGGGSMKISGPNKETYVVIGAYKNEALKEEGGLEKAVADKEMELKGDSSYQLSNYVSSVEGTRAGYMATGRTKMGDKEMAFLEKGLYGSFGKVLLMHAAVVPERLGEYESVVSGVMDSFEVW